MNRRRAQVRNSGRSAKGFAGTALATLLVLGLAVTAQADRTRLKPGFNLFSPDQDVQIGRKYSRDAERQLPMLNDPRVDNYLNQLGHRLDAHVPAGTPAYPFQYKCVNDGVINAFALPGGFIYINRGVIEAADDEAQLAGVMAHETSHVVLRHGTNQASKAYVAQVPLSILGGALGGNSIGAVLAQVGAGFALNSVFLKYSRTDESQADIMGTQILYDTGYDPRAMAQFFEKIQAESKGQSMEFFSSHPNPDHRIERVDEEVEKLGGPPRNYKADSPEFQSIKRYLKSLSPPPKGRTAPRGGNSSGGRPALPSASHRSFDNGSVRLEYPDNWQSYGQGSALTFAPESGVLDDSRGNAALAYGVIVNLFEPHNDSGDVSLENSTDQLVDILQRSNTSMRIVRRHERMRLGGQPALSTYLVNDSPAGGRESDWLVTTLRPDGLMYFICVAPENDYDSYNRAFEDLISSVRFPS